MYFSKAFCVRLSGNNVVSFHLAREECLDDVSSEHADMAGAIGSQKTS